MPLHIVVLVKQVPRFEAMELGPDGRLRREGIEPEMNPYCRRAVAKGVELARETGGTCTVVTLGPPSAEDCLREAIAWGADRGVLVTDPAFAGSDTLATSRALAATIRGLGAVDAVLAGRNSVDADTAQVPPQLAELLGLPFLGGVRELRIEGDRVEARCEHDDGWLVAECRLPAVLSCAERLTAPAKVDPEGRAAVDASRIQRVGAAELGEGPWGQEGSPTRVGDVRRLSIERLRLQLSGDVDAQVRRAVDVLEERGALSAGSADIVEAVPAARREQSGAIVGVVVEPDRARTTRELLGAAAGLAAGVGGRVVAIGSDVPDVREAGAWGADSVVRLEGATVEEDVARALADWCVEVAPWGLLAPSTMWGREVASRLSARTGAGLVGDAVDVDVHDGRLLFWKPAFGGSLVAAVTVTSRMQMATVRGGVMPLRAQRSHVAYVEARATRATSSVRVLERTRDDDIDALGTANAVVTVGTGVPPDSYADLRPLLDMLGAELAGTRKVTDNGWLPRARQVGLTGRSISPILCVAVGVAGKFNHMIGMRSSGFVLAINRDPEALVFDGADVGLVADWREAVPRLVEEIAARRPRPMEVSP